MEPVTLARVAKVAGSLKLSPKRAAINATAFATLTVSVRWAFARTVNNLASSPCGLK